MAIAANATKSEPSGTTTKPPVLDETALDANRGPAHRTPRHQQAELVGRRGAGVPLADDRPLVHHDDPVCERLNLVEVSLIRSTATPSAAAWRR